MKSKVIIAFLVLFSITINAQNTIFLEDFGNTGFFRAPANTYNGFSTDKSFFSADSIAIHNWSSEVSDYSGASGQSFALCGYAAPNLVNTIQIGPINTSEFINIRLSFGAATWFGIPGDYMEITYSTDGSAWIPMDVTDLIEGQYMNAGWGHVTLREILPSSETLYIKFYSTSNAQAVRFDDIKLSGATTDITPPTQPTGLTLLHKDFKSISISWDPSDDENGIENYFIYVNGIFRQASAGTGTTVSYLDPGKDYDISVAAVDPGGNLSPESPALSVSLEALPPDYQYSWQNTHAKVLPEGNLEWAPESFIFEPGSSQRYIDYEGGDDNNDGLSTSTPWKHHPWDSKATGNAKNESGIHTYIFKRGVVYRGVLNAKESGLPGNPIRLTSDPSWGTGEAAFYGSVRITDGWTQSDAATSPNIPEPEKVWYRDINLPETNVIVEIDGDEKQRVRIARTPNYQFTPDDPLKTWPVMTSKTYSEAVGQLVLGDKVNFTQPNADYYKGGTIWSQEDAIVMCTVWGQEILDYDPNKQVITVKNQNFGGVGSHYYIENTPYLLDTTSEFYYDQQQKRLYLRLDGDKDPNTAIIEAATQAELIKINNKQNIEISGLSFGYTSYNNVRYGYADVRSVIRMTGFCSDIIVRNNNFYYINGGISAEGPGSTEFRTRNLTVSDNDFYVVDDLAMVFAGNSNVYLENINILRNRIYDNGGRQRGRWYSSIPAIWGQLISGEIAGNIVDFSWGNGVNMFWGKGGSGDRHVPFIRGLYHHNKASNTLLGTNDYGGIESWQGGPVFCFNNISHNASGYKHYNNTSIGEAFYFDGSFKHIIFNNIASGVSTERNNTAFMQVLGYYNMYIHNTGYNIDNLFSSGSNNLRSNGHNAYLSNIGDNVNNYFRHSIYEDYVPFEAYAYNVSGGNEFTGSILEKSTRFDLDAFKLQLENYNTRKTQTGWNAAAPVLEDPGSFDFRPRLDGEAIDRGVQFFTPFPLSSVVGEWNFYKHPADTTLIMAENFYMTSEFNDRITYHEIPKNHLSIHSLTDSSFRKGILEDWTQGALYFDGNSTYCSLSHSTSSAHTSNNVDMTDNSFIIESYIKTTAGHTDGILVSKTDGMNGYELGLSNSGNVVIKMIYGGAVAELTGSVSVNEGDWHHILAEVNRNGAMRLFIDGEEDQGTLTGALPQPGTSLSNANDLLIGKNADDQFFNGSIDFLRISKATLADARTTIDEVYTWMTEGPFFYDFAGNEPNGKRDAGAIEAGVKNCQLSVSQTLLEFDENSATDEVTILADDGFSLYDVTGEFFTTQLDGNTLSITVDGNENFAEREGEVIVYGCNESSRITIQQSGSPCKIQIMVDTLWFDHQESSRKIKVEANAPLTAKRNASFFMVSVIASGDSIEVSVRDNTLGPERVGEITLSACDQTLIVPVIQQGDPNSVLDMLPEGMEIYPNPVDDNILYITIPEDLVESEVIISDLRGKQVYNQILKSGHQSLELELGTGIYMIQIKSKSLDIRRKLMIQ